MVSHGNLLHYLSSASQVEENDEASTSLTWLPVIHDMGLIESVLEPAFAGFPAYLMAPAAFLQRPSRWLEAITRYRVTNSGGPNFTYDLCVKKIPLEVKESLDLSSWRFAYNGAEPIRAETLTSFYRSFEPCGFSWRSVCPAYGLAEATLVVSSGRRAHEPTLRQMDSAALSEGRLESSKNGGKAGSEFVSSGPPLPGTDVRIVDPETRHQCAPGRIGEIWLSSPSVAQGYWRRPDETADTFSARLAEDLEPRFLRTGDLRRPRRR